MGVRQRQLSSPALLLPLLAGRGWEGALPEVADQERPHPNPPLHAGEGAKHGSSVIPAKAEGLLNSEAGQSSALALTTAIRFIRFLTAGMYG